MLKKVVIVGAGLGGLAVAIALRRQGIDAQIYEKTRKIRHIGAALSLFPNGLNALETIAPGLVVSLKALGSQIHDINVRKSSGELIVHNRVNLIERYNQPMLNIRWSCLRETLASALTPDVIHFNYELVNFQQNDNGVKIYFDNGEAVKADLLIGADGINSTIRQILIGDGSPRYCGSMSWRAVIKYQHCLLRPNGITIMTGTDGKVFTLWDVGSGYIFWGAGALSADVSLSDSASIAKYRVLEKFAGWANPVEDIVKATASKEIIERPICDRHQLTSWSNGRVTLLGDAAHAMMPTLGQGANMAFEDAWELSQFLAHEPTIKAALASYENKRIYRTQVAQARCALQAWIQRTRSYDPNSEIFLPGVIEQAQVSHSEFEDWIYNYTPLEISQI
ncbi:MAG: FAD-dependent monooxygenase [Symploca sp. SIO3C6]|nr:FAD-dependent monooxygenase [Symploca sp. SIO3C6]